MNEHIVKRTLTPDEAFQMFGIPKGTLANLRSQRKGCKFYKVGKRVLYKVNEFENWISSFPVMTMDSIKD